MSDIWSSDATVHRQQALVGYLKTSFPDQCVVETMTVTKRKRKQPGQLQRIPSDTTNVSASPEDIFSTEDIIRVRKQAEAGKVRVVVVLHPLINSQVVIVDANLDDPVALQKSNMMAICVFVKIQSSIGQWLLGVRSA